MTSHGQYHAENAPIPKPPYGIVPPIDAPGAQISDRFSSKKENSFMGIALSGGGSRAANFSAAALQELDQFGFVNRANVISSVSGGGLAGAYYALHGQGTDWSLLRQKLRSNFLNAFLIRWGAPWNWQNIAFTDYTKTDVMADVFDKILFERKTYKDLLLERPIFLANATDVTAGGKRVAFSNEYFLNELHSPLNNLRIATAVATSAAFPGIFDSVTFQRFKLIGYYNDAGSKPWESPSYVHMIDGGATDNLGVETLWDVALTQLYGNYFSKMPSKLEEKPCIIFSVDADAPSTSARFEHVADERNALNRLFNRNVFDATDSLFEARRQETLKKMGLGQKHFGDYLFQNFEDVQQNFVERPNFAKFNIPVNCFPYFGVTRCEVDFSTPIASAQRLSFQCAVWHISLDQISNVGLDIKKSTGPEPYSETARRSQLVRLQALTTQIETNWKLAGPQNCSANRLQNALYTAAKILIRDDEKSRFAVCDYLLKSRIISNGQACKRHFIETAFFDSVVSIDRNLKNFATDSSESVNLPVKCQQTSTQN